MRQDKRVNSHRGIGFIVLVVCTGVFLMAQTGESAPPEGKGNGKGAGQEKAAAQQAQQPKANNAQKATPAPKSKAQASNQSNRGQSAQQSTAKASKGSERVKAVRSARAKDTNVKRTHPHQQRKNLDIANRGNGKAKGEEKRVKLARALPGHAHGQGAGHGLRGHDAALGHVDKLLKSLNKLEKAKWSHNPHDERGQGNNGKVNMRDPYGHDKDSGREKSERGRPIRESEEPVLNLEALVTNFEVVDPYLVYLRELLERYRTYTWASWYVSWLESYIANYTTYSMYDKLRANWSDAINYTFDLGTQEGFEGTALLVTTSLISIHDYDATVYDNWGDSWWGDWRTRDTVHYDAGEVVIEETQEVTLGEDGTFSFSYDVPENYVGYNGNWFEMEVTIAEPESGQTYTFTYDRQLYVYRCPYGIVHDTKTGQPIAGATVTVHNVDGSIVALDKASNPNVTNPQMTDATGRYNCKLGIGKKYYLTVKAPGYEEYRSSVFSERWHIVREDVGLTPSTVLSKK